MRQIISDKSYQVIVKSNFLDLSNYIRVTRVVRMLFIEVKRIS